MGISYVIGYRWNYPLRRGTPPHNFVGSKGSMLRFLLIFGEEMCEMFGVTMMLWATVDLLNANGFKIELKAVYQASEPDTRVRSNLGTEAIIEP